MLAGRSIKLDPAPVYDVRFHPAFIDELADHPKADSLLDEIGHDLSIAENHLRKGAITKIREQHGVALYRYKPSTDREIRILYAPQGRRRDVVMSIPRSSDYRKASLETAIRRVTNWGANN